ncbi:MAG: carboxypeptidase-like regulatory domain-containing protein [Paludibacteraceae bacterium]
MRIKITKAKRISLFLFANLLLFGVFAQKNQTIISGKVFDKNGTPLTGVSITQKESKKGGTVTDINGSYNINAEKGSLLAFSYIGYETQTVKVETTGALDIYLKEKSIYLDEIVVTSLNIPREKKSTRIRCAKSGERCL